MENIGAIRSLSAALDEHARGAVTAYDQCAKAGRDNCDESFERNIVNSKRGKATAVRLRDAIRSFYTCKRSSSDPSVCAAGVQNSIRDIAATTAPREESASLPRTAMEMANAAPLAPSASKIIQQNDLRKEQIVPPMSNSFDPATVYAQLPRSNPLAAIPLRDLVGRSMNDHVRNPFFRDSRPPIFPPLKPSRDLGVDSRRVYELNHLKKQYAALRSGIGYSGSSEVYCNANYSS